MGDDVEVPEDFRTHEIAIGLEVGDDFAREDGPLRLRNRPRRPSMVSRVHPAVPECQRDVQSPEVRCGSNRKAVLESVEAPADRVILPCFLRRGVLKQLRDKHVSRFGIVHQHESIYLATLGGSSVGFLRPPKRKISTTPATNPPMCARYATPDDCPPLTPIWLKI